MRLKFKDLSKINKIFYILFSIVSIVCLLRIIIQFNIWILFLAIMFALKTLDIKSEQKSMNLLDDYENLCKQQSDTIKYLGEKLDESEQKIKELKSKKTTEKKSTAKKTTTKKTVKKEAKKNATK